MPAAEGAGMRPRQGTCHNQPYRKMNKSVEFGDSVICLGDCREVSLEERRR